jgi:hypothetical protein
MVCLSVHTGQRESRIFLTEDQVMQVAYKLMSVAKGGSGVIVLAEEIEPF